MHKLVKKTIYMAPFLLALTILIYQQALSPLEGSLLAIAAFIGFYACGSTAGTPDNHTRIPQDEQSVLFVNIMENLTDPLIFLSSRTTIFMANKSALEMFGANIVERKVSDFLYDSDALTAINKAIETGKSDTVEYSTPKPRVKNYLLRIHVHEKVGNQLPQARTILLTIYDITSIREAERMRVDFVANVSHELRTPLASILGFVETLQGPAKDDPEAASRFLKIMQDEASRMTRLIEDLLSLSQIERDAHIPPGENISLKRIIENVVETLNISLEKRRMTTSFSTDYKSGNITGDRDQLTQVFQNLIDNAIKYGAQGSEIIINLDSFIDKKSHKNFMKITITNQGPGIAEEHIERLTERFYRVDTARSRSLGGTGLGLAIVKHIIQRHEGKLSFESEVGQYVKATVLLPRKS